MDNREEVRIPLQGMDALMTQDLTSAYRVEEGCIIVFIVPLEDGRPGKRVQLCEVEAGKMIPGFAFRDAEFVEWRLLLVAKEDAAITEIPEASTSILRRNFARRSRLPHFEEEGFEKSIVEFYQHELLKDSVFLERGKKQSPKVKTASYSVIKNAFDNNDQHIEESNIPYRAVVIAARNMKQSIAGFDRIKKICGETPDVPSIARAVHLICRDIVLEAEWYKQDIGRVIGTMEGKTVVCTPKGGNRYDLWNVETGKKEPLTKELAQKVDPKAFCIERTLPDRKLSRKDIIKFCTGCIRSWDLWSILLLGLVGTLIGVLMPTLNSKIYDDYIPLGNQNQLIQICVVIGSITLGNLFFSIVKSIAELRVKSHVGYEFQDAVYHRILRLPESFFRNYDSADLAQRLQSISVIINQVLQATVLTGISTVFMIFYLIRMFKYSGKLTWISILMVAIYATIITVLTLRTIQYEKQGTEDHGKASAKLYQYLNGIEKIRTAGVEDRAIYEFLVPFSDRQFAEIRKNRIASVGSVLSGIAMTIFSMVLYLVVVKSKTNISMGSFVGFNTALGTFAGAVLEQISQLIGIYQLKPAYQRFRPILDTAPEDNEESELPGELSGDIILDHIRFAYGEGKPNVINDISLHIYPGEYLGIVGASGGGKSTLLKLLLGFETPNAGMITFDGQNLQKLDKQSFRQNLGVVLQNGKLISGSIFENITITAPEATMKDVQRVIEAVGLKEDIAQMPMGIHTVLSENSSTISGGQQQRILIARAIIRNPSILIFDEATSALDNVTQAAVSESLNRMEATRIVVAHRLSTIKNCDRIIVLDKGQIAEEGNYESLMALHGLFYQLASRQITEE